MNERTEMRVFDSDSASLVLSEVVAAARNLAPHAPERGSVQVNGSWYDPIALAASATGVEPRRLTWRSTVHAFSRLGLETFEIDSPSQRTLPIVDTATGELEFVLTPKLVLQLQRYQGQWVGLRDNAIIEHAPTLRELMISLGERSAAVLKVPSEAQGEP